MSETVHSQWVCTIVLVFALLAPSDFARAGTDCGNGTCDAGEDTCNCIQDCPRTTCTACDCGSSGGVPGRDCFCDADCVMFGDCCANACEVCTVNCCGNGVCDAGEDSCSCLADCPRTTCQPCDCASGSGTDGRDCFCDDVCVAFGDCCPNACEVCGECPPVCGDGTCESGENCESCPADCGCAACETCEGGSCIWVCAVFCDPACCGGCTSCETTCGDAACACDETCSTCPQDCGGCPGACCYDAKGTPICEQTSQAQCESGLSGTFFGVGTSCDSNPCAGPTGACCLPATGSPGPDCVIISPSGCQDAGGTYQGDGTTCEACIGACCGGQLDLTVAGSLGCLETGRSECEDSGGEFRGPGTLCATEQCVGACCFGGGPGGNVAGPLAGCGIMTEPECGVSGGLYQGDGSDCTACLGACCISPDSSNVAGLSIPIGCFQMSPFECVEIFGGEFLGFGTVCQPGFCNPERVDISTKGSLLIFSDVELEFIQGPIAGPGGFNVTKDTVISLTNDYPGEVYVQMYFVNGDPERDAVFTSGPAPILISEAEPGCNWVDCAVLLTPDQSVYWSAASGNPVGCQPFGILDPDLGNGPGRPNPDLLGGPRVLRGFIVAWAVDANGREVNWNHLSGKATIVDYAAQAAWEYSPWAFQALYGEHGQPLPGFGFISLDGFEYEAAFDMLLFDFFAAGSMALSSNGNTVSVDTDLTLHPVSHDLRQEHEPPVTTKAHFDIWNMNERKLSNTRRCITCWDQVLLSQFNAPNNFLLMNLQSDKGKARINGLQANECEENCFRDQIRNGPGFSADNQTAGFLDDLLELDFVCSQDAAILGVAAKILRFGDNTIDYAGSELVGMGTESAFILYDVVGPPGTLRDDAYDRIRPVQSKSIRIDGGRGK